jgi:hypothetical protein
MKLMFTKIELKHVSFVVKQQSLSFYSEVIQNYRDFCGDIC